MIATLGDTTGTSATVPILRRCVNTLLVWIHWNPGALAFGAQAEDLEQMVVNLEARVLGEILDQLVDRAAGKGDGSGAA